MRMLRRLALRAPAASRTHYQYAGGAGTFNPDWAQENWAGRDWGARAFTVGIGGPVGAGKTALVLELCRRLRDSHALAVVTNDIFTREDAEFLQREQAMPADRICAVETGGCPHTAIREDISANMVELERLTGEHCGCRTAPRHGRPPPHPPGAFCAQRRSCCC